jgi:hypothetical protein
MCERSKSQSQIGAPHRRWHRGAEGPSVRTQIEAKSAIATCSWIQAGYRLRAVASTLSTLIADRTESWSLALGQYRALLDRRVFRKTNSSYIKTRLIVTLLHTTREIECADLVISDEEVIAQRNAIDAGLFASMQ